MSESFLYHRLQECSIARPINDNGTLFFGDTEFTHTSKLQDFSASDKSVCRVSLLQQEFSSHAGTHADSPAHFETDVTLSSLPDDLYSGPAFLLDLSHSLGSDLQITRAMIEDALANSKMEMSNGKKRFLIRTNSGQTYPTTPQKHFAYLGKDAATFLINQGTSMVAIDTPSVDHAQEKCLSGAVHGILYQARSAIVENVNLSKLLTGGGEVVTIFDPTRISADARGIAQMYFFPNEKNK